ncbi:MAG: alpha-amylase family glycosyl hydrolase, partial [Candidatus Binatia bacterium]|nr:alpha-amylase family glycosyl hydrolase [Candidatus Binatia bacterium]
MRTAPHWVAGPRIYNLFPLLVGPLPRWTPHLERARRLGFNWVFVNPFHYAGYSGSLYAIKDYYAIDPRLVDPVAGPPAAQLEQMIRTAHELGLKLMMDLVINHTAFDSPLVTEHPDWYKRGVDGKPLHPSAKEGDRTVVWGDLYEIDNAASPDRANLWAYWLTLIEHYASLGFQGFRCDAAYKVPVALWQFLFERVRRSHPGTTFFAELLGCPFDEVLRLARAGFDFIFNSSKWWDFTAPWCLEQYRQTAPLVPSISFPESHDTERLATELHGDQAAVKLRYAFAALFSTGVMIPIGFEYGFRRRLDVVKTRPEDWEQPQWDMSDFITRVNRLKESRRVFNEEG